MLPQQTIQLAIDLRTDRRIEAETLLEMSEEEFSALRRQVMKNRVDREKGAVSLLISTKKSAILEISFHGNLNSFRMGISLSPVELGRNIPS